MSRITFVVRTCDRLDLPGCTITLPLNEAAEYIRDLALIEGVALTLRLPRAAKEGV